MTASSDPSNWQQRPSVGITPAASSNTNSPNQLQQQQHRQHQLQQRRSSNDGASVSVSPSSPVGRNEAFAVGCRDTASPRVSRNNDQCHPPHTGTTDNDTCYSSPVSAQSSSRSSHSRDMICSTNRSVSYYTPSPNHERHYNNTMKIVGLYSPDLSPSADRTPPGRMRALSSPSVSPGDSTATSTRSDYYYSHGNDDDEDNASVPDTSNNISEYKSEIDTIRERGANRRALSLLDMAVTGTTVKPTPTGGLTMKQAAAIAYDKKVQEKTMLKIKLREQKEKYKEELAKTTKRLVAPVKPKLAETTRKPKDSNSTNDTNSNNVDNNNPDTIAEMKFPLEIEREEAAMKKALRLLSTVSELD